MKPALWELKRMHCLMMLLSFLFFFIPETATGEETPDPSNSHQLKTHLKTVIVSNYYPYTFLNKEGVPDGFSVDLIHTVASIMGMDLEISADAWERAVTLLETGEIDFLPMMAYSEERDRIFDFSVPHTIAFDAIFTRVNGKKLKSENDLKGQTVIVMKGDQAYNFLRSSGLVDSEHLLLINSIPEALRLLSSGRGDAALMPKLVGLMILNDLHLTNITRSPIVLESYNRPFSFAVKKGNLLLLERLSQGLSIAKQTGQYREIYNKWFGALEPEESLLKPFLAYGIPLFLALLMIGLVFIIWLFSFKKRIASHTQRLKAEIDERTQVELRFRQITETIREIFWLGSLDWKETYYISPAYEVVWGRTCEELYQNPMSWLEAVAAEDQQEIKSIISGSISAETPEIVFPDFRIKRPDDSIAWISARAFPVRDISGRFYHLAGIAEDITESKRTEDKLRYVSRLYAMLSQVNQAIFRIRDIDELFRKICQVAVESGQFRMAWIGLADEVDGHLKPIAYAGHEDGYLEHIMISTAAGSSKGKGPSGSAFRAGKVIISRDIAADPRMLPWRAEALKRGYRSSASVPFRSKGAPFGTLSLYASEADFFTPDEQKLLQEIADDISFAIDSKLTEIEHRRMEDEKFKLEAQLRQSQKMEAIGSLAGGIAHDLNNILFPISGLSEMLLAENPPDSPQHAKIDQIYKSAQRGSALIKQILAFSRQSNPQKLTIRIQPILEEVISLTQSTILRNIDITSHVPADCGMVLADPTQVHQIMMNLITNACHAVEENGGTIHVGLKEAVIEKDHSLFQNMQTGRYACITVSDTGTGIDQTLIDKIFTPYFTTKDHEKGTGLGLSVVYGIVKEHGGDIQVQSEVGKGTTFYVWLPLLQDAQDYKSANF